MRSPGPPLVDATGADGRPGLSARPALAVGLTGLALTLTGFAIAGPTVAVPGAGLLVLGMLAPLWVRAVLGRLTVQARVLSSTVIEGQPLGIEVTVTGRQLLGRAGARLHHELLGEPAPLPRAGRCEITARARGRGYMTIAPPQLVVTDPVGLASASRRALSPVGTLLVLPRTEPVRWLDGGDVTAGNSAHAGLATGPHTIDIAGLRDYQPGTPATRIHWPALARGGELLERVFVTEHERAPLLVVDPRCAQRDARSLDLVIRAAASLVLALARGGAVDLLLAGQATPLRITASLSTWPSALRALALLEPAPHSATAPRVPSGDDGILYYACTDPGLARAAHHRWAGRTLTLAPPGAGGPAPVLEVAGCVARPVWGAG